MSHRRAASGGMLAVLLVIVSVQNIEPARATASAHPSGGANTNCSALSLTLRPGLNPGRAYMITRAPDIPHGPFVVSLPLYPAATRLTHYVAAPFLDYPADPYLQTASAELQTVDSSDQVSAWYSRTLHACGFHDNGAWTGNATVFTGGTTFTSNMNPNLSVEMSFGDTPSFGTYIGYGVEEVTLRPRPRRSFLHGAYAQVRIGMALPVYRNGRLLPRHLVHATVLRSWNIRHLVTAINSIKDYRTVLPFCHGGSLGFGDAWLTFVRRNHAVVHAYEDGPGDCNGLAVNGVRWLTDEGAVWNQVSHLARRGRGRALKRHLR